MQNHQNNHHLKNNHRENPKAYKGLKRLGLSDLDVSAHFVNPVHLKTWQWRQTFHSVMLTYVQCSDIMPVYSSREPTFQIRIPLHRNITASDNFPSHVIHT
jgi:hypothetical protein